MVGVRRMLCSCSSVYEFREERNKQGRVRRAEDVAHKKSNVRRLALNAESELAMEQRDGHRIARRAGRRVLCGNAPVQPPELVGVRMAEGRMAEGQFSFWRKDHSLWATEAPRELHGRPHRRSQLARGLDVRLGACR